MAFHNQNNACRSLLFYSWFSVLQSWIFSISTFVILVVATTTTTTDAADDNDKVNVLDPLEQLKLDRINMKPWYLQSIKIGNDYELPISPITIIIGLIGILYLLYFWKTSQEFADASHILITDISNESKETLIEWKNLINNDYKKFQQYASKYSKCPSGLNNGGRLGKFRKGDMVPQFDTLVFNPNTIEQTTIGPIQTNFGYHLIFIHSRQLQVVVVPNDTNKKGKKST